MQVVQQCFVHYFQQVVQHCFLYILLRRASAMPHVLAGMCLAWRTNNAAHATRDVPPECLSQKWLRKYVVV